MGVEYTDLVTIGLLVILEGLLSADNALVMAVMVLVLPESQRTRALRYGILGAFVLRTVAILLAKWVIDQLWVKLIGGLYLLYLPVKHFRHRGHHDDPHAKPGGGRILGLSLFWSVVVMVNLVDLVFAIDSILAAVAMSNKLWVIITGALLGIVAIRLVAGQVLSLIKRYPALIDGAYIIIAWVGIKLTVEYLHGMHLIAFEISKEVAIGVVILLFIASYLYARVHGPAGEEDIVEAAEQAERMMPKV